MKNQKASFHYTQKDDRQDASFGCLYFYKHNCINIVADNICFHKDAKNQQK